WVSSNTAVATVAADGTVTVLANAPLATDTTITATLTVGYGDPVTASFVVTALPAQLQLALTPDEPTLALGTVATLTPDFTMTDGSPAPSLDASDLTWLSSDPVLASVDAAGVVSTLKEGQVTISAVLTDTADDYDYDVSDADAVTVSAKAIVDFKLYAESSTTLAEQQTLLIHPIAIYSDKTTAPYTGLLDWTSSDNSNIRIAGSAPPQVNQATPVTITSLILSADVTADITVTDVNAVLTSKTLAVTFIKGALDSALTSVETSVDAVTLPIDVNYQLSAVAILSDNTVKALNTSSGVAWTDDDTGTSTDVTVDGTGGLVTITSAATNNSEITATFDGQEATAALAIKQSGTLYSIEIVPDDITLAIGVNHSLKALGTYQYDVDPATKYLVVDISDKVTWAVTNTTLATETSDQLTGLTVGSTTITASLSAKTATANVTVVSEIATISISPTTLTLSDDSSLQAQAYPVKAYANYTEGYKHEITDQVYWSSTAELTVSNITGKKGEITPLSFSGTPEVTAELFTEKGTTVNNALVVGFETRATTSLDITPATITLDNDEKQEFTATLTYDDATTSDVTELVTWSINNNTDAFVSNVAGLRGQVSAVGNSTATIAVTAILPGSVCDTSACTATATITRRDESATALTVSSDTSIVAIDGTLQFSVTGTFADPVREVDLTQEVVWSTDLTDSMERIATISNALGTKGLLTRIASGTIKVTATYKDITGVSGDIASP
ncbi:Ig-like domain-containing protein, partial [Colwellia sp. MB02u-10]|uniref:Ig-like domain-containing protein n=1 Tax=Colwellia sp. MB02u-10 TaxID=2759828 RepID=UPI0015F5C9D8